MSEHDRYLLTFDSARRMAVKVEQIGEAGELTEVDLPSFLRLLSPDPAASTPQQIIINIYGGGTQGMPVVEQGAEPRKPHFIYAHDFPHKPPKPPKPKE